MNSKLTLLKLFLFAFAVTLGINSNAQLTVSRAAPYNTITYLVNKVLLGNGVQASNITYSGDDTAVGFFNGINSNIGMDSGIILCNGTITDAPGPNNSPSSTYSWPNCTNYSDPDLVSIAHVNINDAAIIEFDFTATSDTISFQYVFGSEEYPEYVNSFNDAFGFFLSGPGINGPYTNNAENIAVLPDGWNTPVTIDSVNCLVHSQFYVCNWPSNPCNEVCPTSASMASTTVQYDGFTVVLTAKAAVQCGQKYHIKLAVGDAGDCAYDSGVFLKSGSFISNGTVVTSSVNFNNSPSPGDTVLYKRSCENASLYFERATATEPDTIILDTSGTAQWGVDYVPLPDTIILPVNVKSDTLSVIPLPNLKPGIQTLIITIVQKICDKPDTQRVTLYIGNPPPLVITEPPSIICYGDSAVLNPVDSGGVGKKYVFLWSTGDTSHTITVHNIKSDTSFVVLLTDACGDSARDTVHVNLVSKTPLTLTTKDTTVNCPTGNVTISALAKGGSSGYKYIWNTGGTTSSITVSPANNTTVYTVAVTDSCGNKATDSLTVKVNDIPLVVSSKDTSIVCPGVVNVSVKAGGGGGGYTYSWGNGATSSSINQFVTKDTTFVVTVTSPCGNQSKKDTVHVTVLPANFPITLSGNTSICIGQGTTLSATGGDTYSWSNGDNTSSITVTPNTTTTYTLTVTNGNCTKDTTITVTVSIPPVITITPPNNICIGDSIILVATGGGSYLWSNGKTSSAISVKPTSATKYTVIVNNGCIDSASTLVTVDASTFTLCCNTTILKGDTVTLHTNGQSNYVWSPSNGLSCFTCPDPIASPTVTTTYTVISTDSNGCTTERTITVVVETPCADFKIPNVFTPNNDGINDDFVINVLNSSSYTIVVYDRWGKEVYSSNDVTKYWNGRYNGTDYVVPDGVYYYIIKASCGDNNYVKKGFVQVMGEAK